MCDNLSLPISSGNTLKSSLVSTSAESLGIRDHPGKTAVCGLLGPEKFAKIFAKNLTGSINEKVKLMITVLIYKGFFVVMCPK